MSQFDQSDFSLGKTFYGPTNTIDTNNLGGADRLGVEKWFVDTRGIGSGNSRSKRKRLCRLVRNSSGITLYGKRALHLKSGTFGCEVDGYSRTTAEGNYVVSDEYLPSGGVRNGDIFWVVIRGPAIVTTTYAGDATNVIAVEDFLVVATAANSTAHTGAGRFEVFALQSPTSAAAALYNAKQMLNRLGRAMSAKTTGETGADVLVDVEYHS